MQILTKETISKIKEDARRQSALNMFDWLAENKINLKGKYRTKNWGRLEAADDGNWFVSINVQYDEYLDDFLSSESEKNQATVRAKSGHMGCTRCKTGKCAFTGIKIKNPDEEQIEFIKKLILFRIAAIKEERIPKCSYIAIAKRGEPLKPCAVHKVCDPKCRAMKNM